MAYSRQPETYQLAKIPHPRDIGVLFRFENAVTAQFPLPLSKRLAIFAIGFEPRFSVHPVALYAPDGSFLRIPTQDLIPSSRSDFVYEVRPILGALRTAADPRELARVWAHLYADEPSRQRT